MPDDIDKLNQDAGLWASTLNVSWATIKVIAKGKIAEAGLNGGVTSYTINGRSVSLSLDFLEKLLSLAEERDGGGLVMQRGIFLE